MIRRMGLELRAMAAFAAMVPKLFLAYRFWVWMDFVARITSMTVFYYFWRAVYAAGGAPGGLTLQETLNYILLAQIFAPVVQSRLPLAIGARVRDGSVGVELLRPLDFQGRWYAETLAVTGTFLVTQIPLAVVAWLFFGMQLPADPRVFAGFAVALMLGCTVIFFFDWIFSCLVFYTTEVWGLWVLREGVAAFCGGLLVPLAMMPGRLQEAILALPFAQALYVPVSILSGIVPVSDIPRLWLTQILWLAGLGLLSRALFRVAVRKIVVQGG